MLIVNAETEAVIGRRDQMLRAAAALASATTSAEPAQEEAR